MASKLTTAKRQSYAVSDKLRIIQFAEQNGNRAAERGFGVSESNVRGSPMPLAKFQSRKNNEPIHASRIIANILSRSRKNLSHHVSCKNKKKIHGLICSHSLTLLDCLCSEIDSLSFFMSI